MSDDKRQNIGGDYFNNAESLALTVPVPLTLHPAEVYLRSLGSGSQRTMQSALNAIGPGYSLLLSPLGKTHKVVQVNLIKSDIVQSKNLNVKNTKLATCQPITPYCSND